MKLPLNILLLLVYFIVTGCDHTGSNTGKAEHTSTGKIEKRSPRGEIVPIKDGYEALLSSLKVSANDRESMFIDEVISILNKFKERRADTTIVTLANIDGVDPIDTVLTRVYIKNDSVFLKSSWYRDGKKLWNAELINPYLWISDEDEFQYDTRSVWITFTEAIYKAIPTFSNRENYAQIPDSMAVEMGYDELHNYGTKSDYLAYLNSFDGQLLLFGDPESGGTLYIWHEPTGQFVTFFRP